MYTPEKMENMPQSTETETELTPSIQLPFSIQGVVVSRDTEYPLAGLRVRACTYGASPLGEALTDRSGRFEVFVPATPTVEQAMKTLHECCHSFFSLDVESADGKLLVTSRHPVAQANLPAKLLVPLPAKPVPATIWREFGERIEQSRVVHLHELARQLMLIPPEQSLFGDWDLETRYSVLVELERSFLDPEGSLRASGVTPSFQALRIPGILDSHQRNLAALSRDPVLETAFSKMTAKAGSFPNLFSVDWVTDPAEFKKGDPGAALAKFEGLYFSDGFTSAAGPTDQALDEMEKLFDSLFNEPTQQTLYRDYLRTIYTGAKGSADYEAYKKKLETRFHQNFETLDNTERPANEILIPILKEILTAPTGASYGFGIAASSIEPQGNRTHREYLDHLIGLTQISAREMGLRHRLDLERPDSAVSSRVQENIATLQGFFADGFQSFPDPFPIFLQHLHGKAPFFLYYDEWVHQRAPFYAENHYQIRRTFAIATFKAGLDVRRRISEGTFSSVEPLALEWPRLYIQAEDRAKLGHQRFSQGQYKPALDEYEGAGILAQEALRALFKWSDTTKEFTASNLLSDLSDELKTIRYLPVDSMEELEAFTKHLQLTISCISQDPI
jgi:hypothetical protein